MKRPTIGGGHKMNQHEKTKREKFKTRHPEGRSQFSLEKKIKRIRSQIKVSTNHLTIALSKVKQPNS